MANTLVSFPAESLVPPASSFAAFTRANERGVYAFDASTVEAVYTPHFPMPAQYGGGTLVVKLQFMMASATSGKVDFEVSVEAVTPNADADDLDASTYFDTANAANMTVPDTAGKVGELSITLSNDDSIAAGDLVRLKIERDADDGTDDTATGDCYLFTVELQES